MNDAIMLTMKPSLTEHILLSRTPETSNAAGLKSISKFVCDNSLFVTVAACIVGVLLYRHHAHSRAVARGRAARAQPVKEVRFAPTVTMVQRQTSDQARPDPEAARLAALDREREEELRKLTKPRETMDNVAAPAPDFDAYSPDNNFEPF